MFKNSWKYPLVILGIVMFLTIGYSAFSHQLNIDDIIAHYRAEADIRITNISIENATNDSVSYTEEYDKESIATEITLPKSDSSLTYKIEITNFGGTYMVISDIDGLPKNLDYTLDNYELNTILCDDNNECKLGITKYIYLTIKHKTPPTTEDNNIYNINLNFKFEEFSYTINYITEKISVPINTKIDSNSSDTIKESNGTYTINKQSNETNLYISTNNLENGKTYILKYKIKKINGTLENIKLFSTSTTEKAFTIDNNYTKKIEDDTQEHIIEYKFEYTKNTETDDQNIYIQINNLESETKQININIYDIEMYEVYQEDEYYYNENVLINSTPSKEGYEYYWNTEPNGNGITYNNGYETTALKDRNGSQFNLYAQWYAVYYLNFRLNKITLPDEYEEVGYLETNGTQFINLGNKYPISAKTVTKLGVSFTNSWIYGYTIGSSGRYGVTLSTIYTHQSSAPYSINPNQYYDLTYDHTNGITINGTQYEFDKTPGEGTSSANNVYLFRANGSSNFGTGKIYYYKQYNNDVLVLDLVPCYRKTDNVLGMYDLVNNVFYTNSGTGTFSYGYNRQKYIIGEAQKIQTNHYTKEGYDFLGWNTEPDGSGISYSNEQEVLNLTNKPGEIINLYAQWPNDYVVKFHPNKNFLPSGFKELGYLETTGSQYINLGTQNPISTNTTIKVGASFTTSWIYGYTKGDSGRYGATTVDLYTGTTNIELNSTANEYYNYIFDHKNGATINGEFIAFESTPSGSSASNNIYLFRANGSTVFGSGKIYYFKQYTNNNIVLNLIPCYRESDNVAGMYDLVNNVFYTNAANNSQFLYGYNTQNFIGNKTENLNTNMYVNEGYTFKGWNTEPDGSGISYTDGEGVQYLTKIQNGEVDLYAQWEKIED